MGTPLSQLAFTSDFAQSSCTFVPIAIESVAGREALAVDWTFGQNQLPSWRMWLDTNTGVILKMQTYDKEGGITIRSESVVNQIRFDDVFADALFGNLSSLPQFSDVSGTPLNPEAPAPPAPAGPDPLHDVYFFVFDHNYGNEKTQLMRVPGSCVAGLIPCSEAEVILPPSELKFSVASLVWSPDGQLAAFPYPISADGNRAALFLFNPQDQSWKSIAKFNYIDPPMWSPDGHTTRELAAFEKASIYPVVWSPNGKQVAFIKMTNDIAQGQDLYTIGVDGKNLQQFYHSAASGMIDLGYSPDGKYLIFEDSDATGRHIFVIDLSTMEKHILTLPNLPLGWWWMAPSWQR